MMPPDTTPLTEAMDREHAQLVADAAAYRALRRGEVVQGCVLCPVDALDKIVTTLSTSLQTMRRAVRVVAE